MSNQTMFKCTTAASLLMLAGAVQAQTETNTMTNIVSVADACDIVAVGADFGVTTVPIPAAGIISLTPNTTVGNLVSGNTAHPGAALDGGAGNDDQLALVTPVAALNGVISTLLSAISTAAPGVYVACTTTPTSITVASGGAGTSAYSLPTAVGGVPAGSFAGKMTGVSGGAGSGNTINYTLTFLGTAVSTPAGAGLPNVFTAAFLATGNIPATQAGTVVPGFYTDTATATINF